MTQIISLIKEGTTFQELSGKLNLSEQQLITKINYLRNQGFLIEPAYDFDSETKLFLSHSFDSVKSNANTEIKLSGDTARFIALSDTHFGHVRDRADYLDMIYEYALKHGIHTFIHAGDLAENYSPGDKYKDKLKVKDPIKTARYIVEHYPKDSSITNYILGGNHDFRTVAHSGVDISTFITQKRPDMVFLGYKLATIEINDSFIAVHHPFLQRERVSPESELIELLGTKKPAFILRGHTHKNLYYSEPFKPPVIFIPALYDDSPEKVPGALDIKINFLGGIISSFEIQSLVMTSKALPAAKVYQKLKI